MAYRKAGVFTRGMPGFAWHVSLAGPRTLDDLRVGQQRLVDRRHEGSLAVQERLADLGHDGARHVLEAAQVGHLRDSVRQGVGGLASDRCAMKQPYRQIIAWLSKPCDLPSCMHNAVV